MPTGNASAAPGTWMDEMVNDLSSAPPWRTLREPRLRLIVWAISLSAVVHLVLTPLAGLLGVFAWLLAPGPVDDVGAEQLRSIPITFLGFEEPTDAEPAGASAGAPTAGVSEVVASPEPSPASPDKEAPKAAEPEAAKATEAPEKPAPVPVAPREIPHPVAMTGIRSELVDSNANVNLLLMTENIRQHPLGPRIGNLIVNFPQWSSFFASGDIDPVRDINRILIVGPQFRRSADVVAILQHGLPMPVLKRAVDRLVQRPPRGRWLGTKMPIALAHADRAERLFALTAPNVLVVAPPHLEKQILAAPPSRFPSPEGGEALVLHVKTPWRALIGLPFRLPESIAWLRLDVLPHEDGGAQLRITAEDADARQASEHASSLSLALNALTNPDLGALGALVGLRSIAFIDRLQFQAKGQRITGQVRITPRQLDRLMVYAEEMIAQWTGRRSGEPRSSDGSTQRHDGSPPPNRPASVPERAAEPPPGG